MTTSALPQVQFHENWQGFGAVPSNGPATSKRRRSTLLGDSLTASNASSRRPSRGVLLETSLASFEFPSFSVTEDGETTIDPSSRRPSVMSSYLQTPAVPPRRLSKHMEPLNDTFSPTLEVPTFFSSTGPRRLSATVSPFSPMSASGMPATMDHSPQTFNTRTRRLTIQDVSQGSQAGSPMDHAPHGRRISIQEPGGRRPSVQEVVSPARKSSIWMPPIQDERPRGRVYGRTGSIVEYDFTDTESVRTRERRASSYTMMVSENESKQALSYWKALLADCVPCHFPIQPSDAAPATTTFETSLPNVRELYHSCVASGWTTSTLFQAAWALVVSVYCSSHDVCYSFSPSPAGVSDDGAVIRRFHRRIAIDYKKTARDFFRDINNSYMDALANRHCAQAEYDSLEESRGPISTTSLSIGVLRKRAARAESAQPEPEVSAFVSVTPLRYLY